VVARAVRELEGLTAREAGGTAARKHEPRHRRRRGQAALPRRRAPRAADGRDEGSVSACGEAVIHQAEELRRKARPRRWTWTRAILQIGENKAGIRVIRKIRVG
jgi:hypothetical protein